MDEPNVEQKAKDLGWSPKEDFRGDPAKWISAEEFVERGESLMPILKANNRKLHDEVASLRGALGETQTLLKNATESIETLKEFTNKETIKSAKGVQKELAAELKEARSEGDTEKEIEIQDKLEETRAAIKAAETKPAKVDPPARTSEDDAIFQDWRKDNAWLFEDAFNGDLTVTVGRRMRADPAYKDLTGRKFLDKVAEEVGKRLDKPRQNGASKVEGGARGSGGGGSDGKSYADLPVDAKAACEGMARKLVGPGRAFKDITEWRKVYTAKYNAE